MRTNKILGALLTCCSVLLTAEARALKRLPDPTSDFIRHNGTQFSESLCVDDPFTFVCKWIQYPSGVIVDSPTRPGNAYLQVAGTTSLNSNYHSVGADIIRQSMQHMDSTIAATAALNARVGLFTYEDKTTIFPEYEHLADTPECAGRCDGQCAVTCTGDGRKYDDLAGVGGVRATCVDDNFMCLATDPYYNTFSVLVHEWAHTVHQYGMDLYWYNAVYEAYINAYTLGIWERSSYAMSNEFEYWAEATGVFLYVSFIGGSQSGGMNSCGGAPGSCGSESEARWWLYEQDVNVYNILVHVWGYDYSNMNVCP